MTDEQHPPQKRRLYCNRCKSSTNHALMGVYVSECPIEGTPFEEKEECSLYSCAGCEAPVLVVSYSNDMDDNDASEAVYPKPNGAERTIKEFVKLPPKLSQTYKEAVDSYNSGCFLLCTIGLRTLLEGVCADKKVGGHNLEQQIDNLRNLLPNGNITSYLHSFRFSGNDAAHQLEALDNWELGAAFDVMEDLLNVIYDLDYKASRLKNATRQIQGRSAGFTF